MLPHAEFIGLSDAITHLHAGGEAPMLRSTLDALADYALDKSSGAGGRRRMEARVEHARLSLERRLNLPCARQRLGFASSVSHALQIVAQALAARPGAIVLLEDDFPSLPLAFATCASGGFELRFVKSGDACEDRLMAAIDESVRAVCVSHVSYLTGRRLDLEALGAACRAVGAALIVDASHSAGVIEIPVQHCDIIVFCCHKFLYGAHGIGVLYWDETRLGSMPVPPLGWNSVGHYQIVDGRLDWGTREYVCAIEAGNPNFASLYALAAALDRLRPFPAADIESHAVALASLFKSELVNRKIPFLTPLRSEQAGSSVSVPCEAAVARAAELAGQGVIVAGSNGRLRFSFHAHNCLEDVERAAGTLVQVGL
jgi:cysteine desulfurase / selenocysteine lyase